MAAIDETYRKEFVDWYKKHKLTINGAALVSLYSDFGSDVALGLVDGYALNTKFGRNPDIDTATSPEDVWGGGGLYTGFDCIVAEVLEVFSSDVNDSGALVSSGSATGGSETTIQDSGATFITDGVAVGDVVINDSKQVHGFISSVDSETQLTVYDMRDGIALSLNEVGDSYRVVTASDTGAAVVKIESLLDSSYDSHSEYIILNGVTPVNTTGSYLRNSRGRVILSGSSGTNEGTITVRQSITTANITLIISSGSGQSAIACDTVPRGETWIVKRMHIGMGRASGANGSADCRLKVRELKGSWQTRRFPTITNGLDFSESDEGGIVIQEFTDIKWNVESVSDNGTIVSGEFEYYRINN